MSSSQILLIGAMVAVGWLWFYLFGRQLIFDIKVAFPLIKKFNNGNELINVNSKRYTFVSLSLCIIFILAITAVFIFVIKKLYIKISFFVGAVICLIMVINSVNPKSKNYFDSFCNSYYRFIENDDLRQSVYEKKYKKIIQLTNNSGVNSDFIPLFNKEDKK